MIGISPRAAGLIQSVLIVLLATTLVSTLGDRGWLGLAISAVAMVVGGHLLRLLFDRLTRPETPADAESHS
jgi:hypothetical protein